MVRAVTIAAVCLGVAFVWFVTSFRSPSAPAPLDQGFQTFSDVLARAIRNEFFRDRALAWCAEAYPRDGCDSRKKCTRHVGATMTQLNHLINFAVHVRSAVQRNVAGDVVECGTWQGGNSIMAAKTLEYLGVKDRRVWLYDSFEGHPVYSGIDAGFNFTAGCSYYKAPLEWVEQHLQRFRVKHNTKVVKGWFEDTLRGGQVPDKISVLRLDADSFVSTTQILDSLYDKVAQHGIIIIDDYYAYAECRRAVHEFRKSRGIDDRLFAGKEEQPETLARAYWVKGSSTIETVPLLNAWDVAKS